MITEIPNANFYSLSSIESPSAPVAVGGKGIMDEVGRLITDENIVLEVGISGDECLLMLDLPTVQIIDIVDEAKIAFDKYVEKNTETTE